MSTPCAPPDSLVQWATSLVVGAVLLLIAALALAPPGPRRRWRSRAFNTLSLLDALADSGLATWSLTLFARMETLYATLTARNQAAPSYCFGGVHGPDRYPIWQRQTAALIDPLQRQALITLCVSAIVLIVVMALTVSRHRAGRRRSALTSTVASASDVLDVLEVSPLHPAAPLLWRAGSRRKRVIAAFVVLLVIVTGLSAFFAVAQYKRTSALPPNCVTGMSAADDQQIRSMGLSLLPSQDTVPVDVRTAIAASEQGLGDTRPASVSCVVTRLAIVDSSSVVEVPRFALVWVVGFRVPGATPGPDTLATPPSVEWTFVDAQSGKYLYGAWMSSVGG